MLTHNRTPKHSTNLSVRFQISTCSVCKCFLSPFKMKSTYFAWIHYSCQTIENINNSMPQSLHFTDKNSQNFDILHISNNCLYMYSLLAEVYSVTLHLVIQTRCRKKNGRLIKATEKILYSTLQFNAFRRTNCNRSFGSFILITSLSVRTPGSTLLFQFKNKIIIIVLIEESEVRQIGSSLVYWNSHITLIYLKHLPQFN